LEKKRARRKDIWRKMVWRKGTWGIGLGERMLVEEKG
jgi:hypothetical protein